MVPLLAEEAKERQRKGGEEAGAGRPKKVEANCPQPLRQAQTRDIAGKAVGVSGRSVQRALIVMKADPQAFSEVERGRLTVTAAAARVKGAERAAQGKRQQVLENAAKRRMMETLSRIEGTCRFIADELNTDVLRSVCTPAEIKLWAGIAKKSGDQLRIFAAKLRKEQLHEIA